MAGLACALLKDNAQEGWFNSCGPGENPIKLANGYCHAREVK